MMADYCCAWKGDCHRCDKSERKTKKKQFMPCIKKSKSICVQSVCIDKRFNIFSCEKLRCDRTISIADLESAGKIIQTQLVL